MKPLTGAVLMCAVVFAGALAVVGATSAAGEPRPSLTESIENLNKEQHRLAVACYSAGLETGRLRGLISESDARGLSVPNKARQLVESAPPSGCRP